MENVGKVIPLIGGVLAWNVGALHLQHFLQECEFVKPHSLRVPFAKFLPVSCI